MKNQKGITLIALIITIIVMMILVAVSVNIALGNGLFKAAQDAAKETKDQLKAENALSKGGVIVDEQSYDSLQEYVDSIGQKKIKFTIDGEEYEVTEGTTWKEALNTINKNLPGVTFVNYSADSTYKKCVSDKCTAKGYYSGDSGYPLLGIGEYIFTEEDGVVIRVYGPVCECGLCISENNDSEEILVESSDGEYNTINENEIVKSSDYSYWT